MSEDASDKHEAAISFLTTEHFTLQGARTSAVSEATGRLQLYLGVLSGFILALALVAQVAEFDGPFFALAFVLLAIVYFLGLATIGRLEQIWVDWFRASQGMNRIRRFFVEQAPDVAPYLTAPTSDDAFVTLGAIGIGGRSRWWQGFVTAVAVVGVVNSVVAGAMGALLGALLSDAGYVIPAITGIVAFVVSFGATAWFFDRQQRRRMDRVEVRFPPEDPEIAPV